MKVLGFETSCDETAVAIYDSEQGLLADEIYSQIDIHQRFGGVVPELASRDHIRKLMPLTEQVLTDSNLKLTDIEGIAYTSGPGLIGAVMVGAMFARSLAYALAVPSVGVHHMEGHLLAPMLDNEKPDFPFLALLVSGGHTQLIQVNAIGDYELLGESLDDAAGEAFDKVAKMLELSYPGGPNVAKLAEQGDAQRFKFPRPMCDRPGLDFSFSGLKTSVLNTVHKHELTEQIKADVAASFQQAVVDTLLYKCKRAIKQTEMQTLVVAGGVSANQALRDGLQAMAQSLSVQVLYPQLRYCTDNAAMIAYAGCQRLMAGQRDDLSLNVKPRWPLSELASI